jgi:hypothetical protein
MCKALRVMAILAALGLTVCIGVVDSLRARAPVPFGLDDHVPGSHGPRGRRGHVATRPSM